MPHGQRVKSLRDLKKLMLDSFVEVTQAGGFYKARVAGNANFVFGATKIQALERLRNTKQYRCPARPMANVEKNYD